jgi:DNA-binding transcriptional LysR family regulator
MVDKIHNMRTSVRVVKTSTFTAVAEESDVTTAQVSCTVSLLGQEVRAILVHRTTRRLAITEAGMKSRKLRHGTPCPSDNANVEARNAATLTQGHIRIHLSPELAQRLVTAALVAYQVAHPDASVDHRDGTKHAKLVADGFDIF